MTAPAVRPAYLKRGFRFIHRETLDPWWKPAPGEKYADAPKATCVVTQVASGVVYWAYLRPDGTRGPGSSYIALPAFIDRYCDPLKALELLIRAEKRYTEYNCVATAADELEEHRYTVTQAQLQDVLGPAFVDALSSYWTGGHFSADDMMQLLDHSGGLPSLYLKIQESL